MGFVRGIKLHYNDNKFGKMYIFELIDMVPLTSV